MRRMSFSATPQQMVARQKTVTRRDVGTWENLQPGDLLVAVEKAMGLKKGERQVVLGTIRVVSNEVVDFWMSLTSADVEAEGFPGKRAIWFIQYVWGPLHPGPVPDLIRRIEFEHVVEEQP